MARHPRSHPSTEHATHRERRAGFRARFLAPRLDPDAVVRPVVNQRLDAVGNVPLTLLIAPPGFGKTTALAHWLGALPAGVAYFAAGPRDADLARFVALFLAAIQTVAPRLGNATLAHMRQGSRPDATTLAESLADELAAASADVTVVIDDYHAITAPEVHAFLGELLHFGLPALHLALASRHDPPFAWARLRLQGRLNEIRARDLRLTQEQTALVLQRAGLLEAPEHLARLIWEQAEGWPAGIRGLAMTFADAPIPLRAEAISSEMVFSHIDDFLVQEVFSLQPPEVQDALLRLAVAPHFDGELAEALIGEEDTETRTRRLHLSELMTACPYIEPEGESG